jgi:glycosyltransferase involved in cell wall biosynthesis
VSVVIPTRDRCDLVPGTIDSVLRLEGPAFRVEVVVVDDGSVDRTPEVLAAYPVRVVRTDGVGISAARNLGIYAATGEFLLFLDHDDELIAPAISAQLTVFAEHPEYGGVFGRAQRTNEELEPYGDPFPSAGLASGAVFEDFLAYQPQIATLLVRASVVAEIGGFNLRFAGIDDWDFALRVAKRWPVGRIDDAVVLFRQRDAAEEDRQWRFARPVTEIYRVNTADLSWAQRLKLRPVWWATRGRNAYTFCRYAADNWSHRRYRRALRSTAYAMRWSPLHTPHNLYREYRASRARAGSSDARS